jgi:hypothetical protein
LAEFYLGLLPRCIGPCEAGIRVLDTVALPGGGEQEALRRVACTQAMDDGAPFRLRSDAGVSVCVWRDDRELVVPDTSDPALRRIIGADRDSFVAQRCQAFPAVVGLPLRDGEGKFSGTIYVTRPSKDAFTDMEIRRVRAVTGLIGKELARCDEEDFRGLQLEVQRLILDLAARNVRGQLGPEALAGFRRELLEAMRCYLGAEVGLVRDAGGPHGGADPTPDQELDGRRCRVVSFPAEDRRLLGLFDAEAVAHCQRAVLTLGPPEGRLALFGVAAPRTGALSVRRVNRLQGLLDGQLPVLLPWLNILGSAR